MNLGTERNVMIGKGEAVVQGRGGDTTGGKEKIRPLWRGWGARLKNIRRGGVLTKGGGGMGERKRDRTGKKRSGR